MFCFRVDNERKNRYYRARHGLVCIRGVADEEEVFDPVIEAVRLERAYAAGQQHAQLHGGRTVSVRRVKTYVADEPLGFVGDLF